MTEQEQKAAMMDLLLKNEAQSSKVACLESRIHDFAPPLLTLGNAIKSNFELVTPSADHDNRFLVRHPVQQQEPAEIVIDLDRLRTLLGEYREAVTEKERIEACMERGGLTRFIR